MTDVTMIAAMGRDRSIGRQGELCFRLPEDLRRFKTLTTGKAVIMGRLTWESLPRKPLPNRVNIVLSRSAGHSSGMAGAFPAASAEAALAMAGNVPAMVIGGGDIYRLFLPLANRIHLTHVDAQTPGADAFFPEFRESSDWTLVESVPGAALPAGGAVTYQTWERPVRSSSP